MKLTPHPWPRVSFLFDELKAYMQFDARCEQALMEAYPHVEPHFDETVDAFYVALEANPRTSALFEGPEQMARLRKTLRRWMVECFTGPWDLTYFESRRRIGQVHVDVGLLPHFMSGAMNVVRLYLLRAIDGAGLSFQHVEAFERVIDLELALMHQSYWDYLMELKLTVPVALTTGLAHEIRNPLNAITLNLKLLERRLEAHNASESIPIVEAVRGEVRRISALTSEIMDFAKPVELKCVWHRVDQLLEDIRAVYLAPFEAAQVTLTTASSGLPDCYCDIDRMRQVIVNLLGNAADAVDAGGEVKLLIDVADDVTTIIVEDNGVGMEPSAVYRLFELFYTQKATGTGLGLPIVKNIVDAHSGHIQVDTKLGAGMKFIIQLPRPQRS